MGIPSAVAAIGTPPAGDAASQVVQGLFNAVGTSAVVQLYGPFNVSIYGAGGPNGAWTGTVALQRSFDGGVTWLVCAMSSGSAQAVYTSGNDVSMTLYEPEMGVLYRLACTAFTAGPIYYRFSISGQAARTWSAQR